MVAFKSPNDKEPSADQPPRGPMFEIGDRMAKIIWAHAELGEVVLRWPSLSPDRQQQILDLVRQE